ncbi:MAG TPA: inositol monophosphatase family protein [Xanthomonadales bacterium]|nr:inositol monophosphatase family protein [Xanthomonadales bacterium]
MRKGALNIAVKAARTAGAVIVRHMNRLDSLTIVEKGRNDFASEVDRLAEAEVVREIRRAFPEHAILAEEGGATPGKGRPRFQWVIDPLDGTHNYLRGFPHFSVSIALLENGEPVHGVVYDPVRDELFTASKGAGALLNERRIRVATRTGLPGALLCTGFPFRQRQHLDSHLAMTRALLGEAEDIRRTGSAALDLAYVACGRIDAYWEMGLHPWDMAAGQLLVREAGGRCTDFTGGDDFMKSGHIVAANLKVGDAVVAAIKPHLTATLR